MEWRPCTLTWHLCGGIVPLKCLSQVICGSGIGIGIGMAWDAAHIKHNFYLGLATGAAGRHSQIKSESTERLSLPDMGAVAVGMEIACSRGT